MAAVLLPTSPTSAAYSPPSSSPRVALIGDSTIDNLVWVGGIKKSVPALLHHHLQHSFVIHNLAADAFTSEDVLKGACPVVSGHARAAAGDPFPTSSPSGKFEPLKEVAKLKPDYAVLSVGGNDVREVLGGMHRLPARLAALQKNYPLIVQSIVQGGTERLVLMTQYRPHRTEDEAYSVYAAMATLPGPGDPLQKLHGLMQLVYAPIFELARAHRLPIVDLTRSMDCDNEGLYCCQIEPSAAGSELIAGLLAHVLQNHDWEKGGSRVYYHADCKSAGKEAVSRGSALASTAAGAGAPADGAAAVPAPSPVAPVVSEDNKEGFVWILK